MSSARRGKADGRRHAPSLVGRLLALPCLALLALATLGAPASASVDRPHCILAANATATADSDGHFLIARAGQTTTILTSRDDAPAVHHAVASFARDIQAAVPGSHVEARNVSSTSAWMRTSQLVSRSGSPDSDDQLTIAVGSLDASSLAQHLTRQTDSLRSEADKVQGQWEAWSSGLTQDRSTLVLFGSDKRGTVYALYELSEQMGISPWHWFADVPPNAAHDALYYPSSSDPASPSRCSQPPPHVKYRGIFLNDEEPALTNWARKHFRGPFPPSDNPNAFNDQMYAHVFELLLRLRANYLWPAMWHDTFAVAGLDKLPGGGKNGTGAAGPNLMLANNMGIVMGTSHQEPMARNTPEWTTWGAGQWDFDVNADNLTDFWRYGAQRSDGLDTVYTVGMRGNGDIGLEGASVALLEKIVGVQRGLLPANASQLWCMYKEVQGWYDKGLAVPDDVILLWTDDNWGQIRRIPDDVEKSRKGGSGTYYHADYVGSPRSYKWQNTNNLMNVWEQLNVAFKNQQTELFILNVGDLKPMEVPISFMMEMAYRPSRLAAPQAVMAWVERWCARTFATDEGGEVAKKLAEVVYGYSELNARIKPELVNATTWSLLRHREAERVLESWRGLVKLVEEDLAPRFEGTRHWSAFYQLVAFPTLASANLNELYVAVGRNSLRSSQSSNVANRHAAEAQRRFAHDAELTRRYHALEDGKWDHMMSQTHINYAYWQQPMRNSLPPLSFMHIDTEEFPDTSAQSNLRVTIDGSAGAWPGDNEHNCAIGYNCPDPTLPKLSRYDVDQNRSLYISGADGSEVRFRAASNATWLRLSQSEGWLARGSDDEIEASLSVDWAEVGRMESQWGCNATNAFDRSVTGVVSVNATGEGATGHVGIPAPAPVKVQMVIFPCPAPSGLAEGTYLPSSPGAEDKAGWLSMPASEAKRMPASSGEGDWVHLPRSGLTGSSMTLLPATLPSLSIDNGTAPSLEWTFHLPPSMTSSSGNGTARQVNVTTYLAPTLNYRRNRPLKYVLEMDGDAASRREVRPVADDTVPGGAPPDWNAVTAAGVRTNTTTLDVGSANKHGDVHALRMYGLEPGLVVQKVVIGLPMGDVSAMGPPESPRVGAA
ncbi:uncharacterized protein PFL1_06142 [Pseudozyma flocculosa PF-1]|uniref:Gylcosyl hydrolase 115 C-terminal domain-containing protein n=2 Tax=Pseudozyma flocculosa TaxID=84751 RepID=A0A5C3F7K7_9BASI|nr:uncharacterized protein PFL1_06142 [Pseudozyma flocculosa PF-1]EPQ26207.1 hypothetical protein PFL1_06142 [Pseudozyma flocculosa PF-1]SPO40160.1 uncharacterized protein PSFLO_05642 [Pseudozyma flocculosa]